MRFLKFFQCFFALYDLTDRCHVRAQALGKPVKAAAFDRHYNIMKGLFLLCPCFQLHQPGVDKTRNLPLLLLILKKTDDRSRVNGAPLQLLKKLSGGFLIQLLRKVLR